jgi:hypothetical protein
MKPMTGFVGRPTLHNMIKGQLHDNIERAKGSRILVIHGAEGTGKTQLLLDYISKYKSDYQGVYWIDGTSRLSMEKDFTMIYRLLFGKLSEDITNLPDIGVLVQYVRTWFSSNLRRRILVFDGANSISKDDSQYYDIHDFIADGADLDIIITTRVAEAEQLKPLRCIHVEAMEEKGVANAGVESSGSNAPQTTLLQEAIWNNDQQTAKGLLQKGVAVAATDSQGKTTLHYAAERGSLETFEAVLREYKNKDYDLNAKDPAGLSALHMAAQGGNARIVQLLLDNGADINIENHAQGTALHTAAIMGHDSVARLLLMKNIDAWATDNFGRSAADWARLRGNQRIVQLIDRYSP